MTIEVKQLIIRAIVDERGAEHPQSAASPRPAGVAMSQDGLRQGPVSGRGMKRDRDALVGDITRRVLRELQKRQGR